MNNTAPNEGVFLKNAKFDVPSGLVVFLVALPLCLGIALASGAPLFAGLIAGVVGGLVVGIASGSHVSVSGPAAGLAVIVATSIQHLGSYSVFLVAVVLAGAIQLGFGFLRAGVLANYVPNSVIKGMLAAIGVVIILKQIPHALGRDLDFEGDLSFFEQLSGSNTFLDIVKALYSAHPTAVGIAGLSLLILALWELPLIKKNAALSLVPAPLLVVVLGVLANEASRLLVNAHLTEAEGHLVSMPVSANVFEFIGHFIWPDWSAWSNRQVWITAGTLAVVGSIESLLSLEAADKLDPFRRISDPNRELKAQGVGNVISGLLGGLPVTSVIVRSSANVYAGARTRLSTLVHGALLLLSVLLFPVWLNKIPLAALAAILLAIGYKLTKLALYRDMYRAGMDQFLPFFITVLAIVLSDLLTGIAIGMAVGFFFVIKTNHASSITVVSQDNCYLVRLNKNLSFVNKTELKQKLMLLPANSKVIIDGNKATYIDEDIYDVISDFQKNALFRSIDVEFKNFFAKSLSRRTEESEHGKLQKAASGE